MGKEGISTICSSLYIDGLVQDCSNSIANALELLQSCTKPSMHSYSRYNKNTACLPWWCHQMETFSALLAFCAGKSQVTGESPHKGQWRRALMFPLICTWINNWENNSEAGDLRRHRAHYDVSVMMMWSARYPKGMSAATVLTATVLTAGQHRPLTSREMCGSLYCIFLLSSTYNRNTAWLRDTVRQKSLRKSAAAGQTTGPPRLLTSRGTSTWPYRITAQYSFYPVQLYS